MKLLVFTDLHGNMKAISRLSKLSEKADYSICAGDLTTMERDIEVVVSRLAGFKSPVIVIPGNHEDEDRLKELCKTRKNLIYLHKAVHHFDDYVFLGYGGGGFASADPKFKKIADSFFMKEIEGKRRIIMVTHGPPYKTVVDKINGSHAGDKNYRSFIESAKPHLVICGHLHENAGKSEKIGRTLIINPGPQGAVINI